MKRALITTCLAVFAALASPAAAETAGQRVQDAIVAQLGSQGFTRVRISNTFLGRVRIYATGNGISREIIFNPRTGEILRDYWDDDDELEDGLVAPSTSRGDDDDSSTDARDDDKDDDEVKDDDRGDTGADSSDDDSSDDKSDDRDDSDDEQDDEDEKDERDEPDDDEEDDDEKDDEEDD